MIAHTASLRAGRNDDVQLIAFDLGGVLATVNKNVNQNFFATNDFELLTKGLICPETFFSYVSNRSGKGIRELKLEFKNMVRALNGAEKLLLSLTRPFTFWSNINVCHFEHILNQHPAFRAYDSRASGLSFKLRLKKPEMRFFETCLHASNLDPGSILFLDDTMSNVTAARHLGIPAECVTCLTDLTASLSQRSLISKLNGDSLFP